jgi:peptidoglycan/xylan/chitin deacetylase (PgdA/CDA1 family)
MYHRVAEIAFDPWRLAVSPERFARQIEMLACAREVVPLSWLAAKLVTGRVPKRVAAITFDDGYADVRTNALPVLERHGTPATVFLTTGALGRRVEFWWDRLARIVLAPAVMPPELRLVLADRDHVWALEGAAGAEPGPAPPQRLEVYLAIWKSLYLCDEAVREARLAELERQVAAAPPPGPLDRAFDFDEVRVMAASGLVDIGAHTVTHPSLPSLPERRQRSEIEDSRRACEDAAGRFIDGFAYPFGDHDGVARRLVRELGFAYACSTDPRAVTSGRELHGLPRLAVEDMDGEAFDAFLRADA